MTNNIIGRIYLITNIINNKKYVGQTIKPIEKRLKEHFKSAYIEKRDTYFCRAIIKYDKDNFNIICLEDNILVSELDAAEEYWIAWYETFGKHGYNSTSGGKQGRMSEETKKKISAAHKGVPKSEEAKRNSSIAQKGKHVGSLNHFYGKKHSEETIKKIKKTLEGKLSGENHPFYGKKHSEESKNKISASKVGKQVGEKHPNRKLTEKDVLEIRASYKDGVSKEILAKKYNVGKSAIDKIVYKQTWKHI